MAGKPKGDCDSHLIFLQIPLLRISQKWQESRKAIVTRPALRQGGQLAHDGQKWQESRKAIVTSYRVQLYILPGIRQKWQESRKAIVTSY